MDRIKGRITALKDELEDKEIMIDDLTAQLKEEQQKKQEVRLLSMM